MTERKVYRPEEKMSIVMEGISGTILVADLCRKYDLKPARFYYWKEQLLNSASKIALMESIAYRFRNKEHLKTAIYFRCGNLQLYP